MLHQFRTWPTVSGFRSPLLSGDRVCAVVPEATVGILRVVDRVSVPWRNGVGVTSEIVVSPSPGDFDWRLSIATVDSDAPFSTFVGVDRCLLALSEQGLELIDEGRVVRLGAFESHHFAGEDEVASNRVTRPTLDLNLMTRRGRCSGTLESHRVTGSWSITAAPEESIVVVIVLGSFMLGSSAHGAEPLAMLDAIRLDGIETASAAVTLTAGSLTTVTLTGVGQIVVARVVCAA